MIVQLDPEEFAVVGMGVTITFAPVKGTGQIGIEHVQEGKFVEGKWVGRRWLNGDQTHQGRHIHFPDGRWTMQRVSLYRY
jgi:beta-galactosidase GanA